MQTNNDVVVASSFRAILAKWLKATAAGIDWVWELHLEANAARSAAYHRLPY